MRELALFCPRCRERIAENWSFCPRCGARLPSAEGSGREPYGSAITDIFKDIERQMKEVLGTDLSGNIEFFDLKPEFIKKHPFYRSGGFRVKITRSGDGPPNIDIKAFGDMDEKLAEKMKEAFRKQVRMKAGTKPKPTPEEKPEDELAEKHREEAPARIVSRYKEPTATTRWTGDHLVVDLDLPDVKSADDIEIVKLGESIEVKAFAGDKGYFKILNIPKEAKLISKKFRGSKLSMEIG